MTFSEKNEVLEAIDTFERVSAPDSEGSRCDSKPLEALRGAVRELFELACRSPGSGAYLFAESGWMENGSESPTAFETLSGQVRAAQNAGELRAGDVSLMTTLIACTVIGTADLAQYPRATPGTGASGAEIAALFLLDLLAMKKGD
jgi:hypothetical protein